MLKAIGIAGSPRRNGNSSTLLKAALRGAASAGAETDLVHLNDLTFRGCQGCVRCAPEGECVVRDALTPVFAALRLADIWILSSPIYFDGVSGQLKTFFDRCVWLANVDGETKPRLTGKRRGAIIVTYEAGPTDYYRDIAQHLANYFSWMGDFGTAQIMSESDLGPPDAAQAKSDLLAKAEALGKQLVDELKSELGDSGAV